MQKVQLYTVISKALEITVAIHQDKASINSIPMCSAIEKIAKDLKQKLENSEQLCLVLRSLLLVTKS